MARKNAALHLASLCVLCAGYLLCRYVFFAVHGMKQWPACLFLLGLVAVVIVGALKLKAMYCGEHYTLVTSSPYFYIALTTMILGTQLFLTGFIGELVVRNSPRRNDYEIEEELNLDTAEKPE